MFKSKKEEGKSEKKKSQGRGSQSQSRKVTERLQNKA